MTPEIMRAVGRWVATCMPLMLAGIEELARGKELELEKWRQAAQQYEELLPTLRTWEDDAAQAKLRPLGELARALTTTDLEEAATLSANIPAVKEFDFARLMGRAVIARRRAATEGVSRPETFTDLAEALYALLPLAPSRELAGQALCRSVESYRSAVEGFAGQGDLAKALTPFTNFLALANEAVMHFETPDYLEDALTWGERFIAAFPEPDEKSALAMCVVAHNLINTCSWLARNGSAPELYFGKQVANAFYGLVLCRMRLAPDRAATWSQLHEGILRGLVFGNLNLALTEGTPFEQHADAAWNYYQEYQALVSTQDDPDAKQRCDELGIQLQRQLARVKAGWAPPQSNVQKLEELDDEAVTDQITSRREQTREIADNIRALPPDEQRRELETIIEETYRELESGLLAVMAEIGLNHHVCRFFAALGAIANGKLGKLTPEAVFFWAVRTEGLENAPRGHRGQIHRRQQQPAVSHFQDEVSALVCLDKAAALSLVVQNHPDRRAWLQSLLRNYNARLLASVIPKMAGAKYIDHRKQSSAGDLMALLQMLPGECDESLWEEYRAATRELEQ